MHMYIIEFAIRGSVTAVTSLWDCSLFFSLIGWPREPRPRIAVGHGVRMHPSPLPSIILTLPFHSEFQIPQNGIPHSNFLSHSKVEPLAPNTNIKSTTGYGPRYSLWLASHFTPVILPW